MGSLFKKLFHIDDAEKLKKDSYMSGMMMSLITILICLAAMCGSAYAFFTATLTSGNNVIQAADYNIQVELVSEVSSEGEEEAIDPVVEAPVVADSVAADPEALEPIVEDTPEPNESNYESVKDENGKYTLKFSSDSENYGEFIFRLRKEGTASTGYCKVTFEMDTKSITGYTKQIGAVLNEDGSGETVDERYIIVLVPAGKTVVVSFEAQWGTYGGNALIEDEELNLGGLFEVEPLLEESEESEEEPPLEGEEQPPVEGEEQPPVEGEEQPPVEGEEQPPVEGEEQPPVEGEEQPPVEGEEQSPVEGEEQPPVEGEEQPPVEGEEQPPTEAVEAEQQQEPETGEEQTIEE